MDDKKIILPKDFIDSVKDLLGDELDDFIASYSKERYYGLRRNPLKYSKEDFEASMPFDLEPVAWADEGYYYKEDDRPGRHALHEGGAYYIQEPSAMSAVAMLDPKPGDVVADLCAAPGGKSTQIAGRMAGQGLLVSNEFVKDRAKILSSNIERMGISNALVLNESTDSLAGRFPSFFDKVLVDAPCSGEGMFRKEENAIPEWSLENTKMCHERQLLILDNAAQMLKAGGTLVYSTCTFNSLENEGSVNEFLSKHPEFSLVESKRLWPHKDKGEGHFVAKFLKQGTLTPTDFSDVKISKSVESLTLQVKDFLINEIGIKEEKVSSLLEGRTLATFGDNIYLLPPKITSLQGLKVERAGLHIAVSKKNRLEPSHSLALCITLNDLNKHVDISDDEAIKYLRGETLNTDPDLKGWTVLFLRGCSLGFAKADRGILKNHYPKGLRK